MADLKFSCPHCGQHIEAGKEYAEVQINCPTCHGNLVVPAPAAAPTLTPAPVLLRPVAPSPPPPVQVSAPAAPAASSSGGCPSCGAALPRGAVLCTHCGYNLVTRQRMVAGRPAALGAPTDAHRQAPWYKTAWPYIGATLLIMGVLYFLGRENPAMKLAFWGIAAAYVLIVHIIVIVTAFREGTGTGFLTLCVPFYALYFVFKVSDNDTLKLMYGFAVIINIASRFVD